MFQIIYVSSAVVLFSKTALLNLLDRCRENNAKSGITGLLLYKDGAFMQVLEGEERAVRTTYAKIGRDPRHQGMITLLQKPIDERYFPDWLMALRDLSSSEASATPGFSPFLNTALTDQAFSSNPSSSEKLLRLFKRTN